MDKQQHREKVVEWNNERQLLKERRQRRQIERVTIAGASTKQRLKERERYKPAVDGMEMVHA
jgi:hypothetical protein